MNDLLYRNKRHSIPECLVDHAAGYPLLLASLVVTGLLIKPVRSQSIPVPRIDGEWWQVAGNPHRKAELGEHATLSQYRAAASELVVDRPWAAKTLTMLVVIASRLAYIVVATQHVSNRRPLQVIGCAGDLHYNRPGFALRWN